MKKILIIGLILIVLAVLLLGCQKKETATASLDFEDTAIDKDLDSLDKDLNLSELDEIDAELSELGS